MLSSSNRKPINRPAGRPTANRFSVGAARLITPNAMLAIKSAVAAGNAILSAPANIWLPQAATVHAPSAPKRLAERQYFEAVRDQPQRRQMAAEREENQETQDHEELADDGHGNAALRVDHRR